MRLIDSLLGREPVRAVESSMVISETWKSSSRERVGDNFISWSTDGVGGNPIVFAVLNARINLFTEAEFKFRNLSDKKLFGSPELLKLERPWPAGTTGDLLARMEQDVFLAGNAFIRDAGSRLERLRPDRVEIVTLMDNATGATEVVGYVYRRDGISEEFYPVEQVAHWAPIPDPLAEHKGMSVLTPVVREINSDLAMTTHKQTFFDNSATPNLVIKYNTKLTKETIDRLRERFNARYSGPTGEKTMVLDEGADMTIVGNSFEQMAFTDVQKAGEARIAMAASVPPIVAGLQAGLDAATYSNYGQALKAFGDNFMRAHWRSVCAALEPLVNVPAGARLWYDTTDIAALQEGESQRAEANRTRATAMGELIRAGYTPDSVTNAVIADDFSLLSHTGAIPTALYPEGKVPTP
jgi:HK97 family phage portal protein